MRRTVVKAPRRCRFPARHCMDVAGEHPGMWGRAPTGGQIRARDPARVCHDVSRSPTWSVRRSRTRSGQVHRARRGERRGRPTGNQRRGRRWKTLDAGDEKKPTEEQVLRPALSTRARKSYGSCRGTLPGARTASRERERRRCKSRTVAEPGRQDVSTPRAMERVPSLTPGPGPPPAGTPQGLW